MEAATDLLLEIRQNASGVYGRWEGTGTQHDVLVAAGYTCALAYDTIRNWRGDELDWEQFMREVRTMADYYHGRPPAFLRASAVEESGT